MTRLMDSSKSSWRLGRHSRISEFHRQPLKLLSDHQDSTPCVGPSRYVPGAPPPWQEMDICRERKARVKNTTGNPMDGDEQRAASYFQRVNWFCEKPWDVTSSFSLGFQTMEQTCDFVSMEFTHEPDPLTFQKRSVLSAVPPPEARRPLCHGHHARAFTAAVCSVRVNFGRCPPLLPSPASQMFS